LSVEGHEHERPRKPVCCREVDRVERADSLKASDLRCPSKTGAVHGDDSEVVPVVVQPPSLLGLYRLVKP
jgi:hypothetical protein